MNNGRDCPHGRQVGKCDTCDLITAELELEKLTAERNALAAQVEQLKGIKPQIPPRPPFGGGLPRYGINWNGPEQPLAVPMDDGYWTPYHLAEAHNVELAAQVEVLKQIGYLADGARVEASEGNGGEEKRWLHKLYLAVGDYDCTATPADCLAQVRIPQNADDAAAMALLGTNWLQQNAPERLTEYMNQVRAEAGLAGLLECEKWFYCDESDPSDCLKAANQYAERIRQGGAS